jgi:hypothetical protein
MGKKEKLRKMVLEGDVSAMEKKGKELLTVVFQQWEKKGKKSLISGVSAMGKKWK